MYVDKETRDIYKEIDDPYNIVSKGSTDPENFVRGGPNLKTFSLCFFLFCLFCFVLFFS